MGRLKKGSSSRRLDTYQICVTIIEARHLEPNTHPQVVVRVGSRKKKTAVRKRTDNPYYNEYFVFDLTCTMDALLSTRIEIAVYLCGRIKRSKFHGSIAFEVATVWDQPDHQYYHKWAMLANPRDPTGGPRGYVKCNITVHAKGEKFKMPPETDADDDIEGNLLLPLGDARHFAARLRARYVFTVHRAEDLPDRPASSDNRAYYVRVSFAGMKASTRVGYGGSPRFDEKIVFREMFPPLCHRARIAIKRRSSSGCRRGETVASYLLNLKNISNSGEYGFLPTFGPSFLHLYADGNSDTTGPIYRGRILLSLQTEIERTEAAGATGVYVEPTASIIESGFWRAEEYLLVGVLYEASMIERSFLSRGKSVSFEISLGNAGNRTYSAHQRVCDEEDESEEDEEDGKGKKNDKDELAGPAMGCAHPDSQSETLAQVTASLDGKYNYVPIGPKKPCMFVKSYWPNTEWRTKNSNRLVYIANHLESELEKLEVLIAAGQDSAYSAYNNATRNLRRQCSTYLQSLQETATRQDEETFSMTVLDRHRFNHCALEIESVLERLKVNGELVDNRYLSVAMLHAYEHLRTIRSICQDPQHGLPDVFLWLLSGSRRLAYARVPATQLAYSVDRSERGSDCGQRLNLYLDRQGRENKPVCKVEIFLWLGKKENAGACWSALSPGYILDEEDVYAGILDSFPRYLEYEEASKFQLRAHIFQGRFEPGMDSSGLLDPMVRVIFRGYTMTTKVMKQTLDPFWDQTLTFPSIDIHGKREHVKKQPPKVVLEAFDRDYCNSLELYGRCVASPLVRLNTETHYADSDFPTKLRWHKFNGTPNKPASADFGGAVLAALELLEISDKDTQDQSDDSSDSVQRVPVGIRPQMASYRLEVIFWGVRDMKRLSLVPVLRPKIVVECASARIESQVMENVKKFANFRENRVAVDLEMPEEEMYYPPITIKAYDSRGFGCFKFVGVCSLPTIHVFMQRLVTKSEYEAAIYHSGKKSRPVVKNHHAIPIELKPEAAEAMALTSYKSLSRRKPARQTTAASSGNGGRRFLGRLLRWRRPDVPPPPASDTDESQDWWSKYYVSLEEEKNRKRGLVPTSEPWQGNLATLRIYETELEAQSEFSGFQDRLRTFELRRGKKVDDPKYDEKSYAGKFKGFVAVYRWPHPEGLACVNRLGQSVSFGLCSDYPSQEPLQLLVRLYVVKAINLRPSDPLTGKADPYLRVQLGKNRVNDRKNYIPNQLNPTFGKLIELEATFPKDHTLTIQVWDYDATSADDLIGETRVDIESRFYSRHRAHCGLSTRYDVEGYNTWRDREKPSQILRQLCRRNNLPPPEFWNDYVSIAKKKFSCRACPEDDSDREEHMALSVLHQWADFPICGCALVSEYVERRSLFNPKRLGLEQGKLELWIDMFPVDELPAKPAVDITPQAPEDYELRVTVWNTEEVPLVDNQFLTGEKCSDVYVKGWLLTEDTQRTDVHYNSLTGEGNFNWRFVFRFTWAMAERMMIVKRRTSIFAKDATEQKMPCKLNIQVWDSDHFSKDDFLGALSLDLAHMPRGSPTAQSCSLKLIDPQSPRMNLFRAQRTRAWWPLSTSSPDGRYSPAGKIELEMMVLPVSKAEEQPVGKGREPPEALPPPDRPDTSFSWFRNPWKAFCFVVCRYYRWRILGCCALVLFILLVACAVYAFPGYFVKRLLGA